MRTFRAVVAFALVVTIACGSALALPGWEGDVPFGLGANVLDAAKVGKPLRLSMYATGLYDTSVVGVVHVSLPQGVTLVDGDATITCHPGREARNWEMTIRI